MIDSRPEDAPREISFDEFSKQDPIPQAILDRNVGFLSRFGIAVIHGSDELDEFEGAAIAIGNLEFALLHYAGYPKNTTTLYLPRKFKDVSEITEITHFVLKQFDIPPALISWKRADDPAL